MSYWLFEWLWAVVKVGVGYGGWRRDMKNVVMERLSIQHIIENDDGYLSMIRDDDG